MARRGQSQAPDPGADPRSAGFPPNSPISPVTSPSRASQSTLFLAPLFKCRLRVYRKKMPRTQVMGYWGTNGFQHQHQWRGEAVPELRFGLGALVSGEIFLS